ncbi:MAG: diacylglycerol kinase family protein [Terrimicrobiaceae bacterium]
MKKVLVILNPAAKSDRARAMKEKIEALSPRIVVRMTSAAGDARELAGRALDEGFEAIVAAGGDGTVNEVANGVAGSDARFGILPVGTMNVFASELGIPQNNLAAAWGVIGEGFLRELDLPMANDSFFVQLAGIGLDAEVVRLTTPESKKSLGPVSYLLTLAQVAAVRPPVVLLDPVDSHRREGSFVLVGNGRLYGGPFELFKNARLDDGLLDVLVFKNQSHWDVVRYFQAIAFGSHADLPDVEYFQTKAMNVHSSASVPVELDGELADVLPCAFGFHSKKFSVIAPHPK